MNTFVMNAVTLTTTATTTSERLAAEEDSETGAATVEAEQIEGKRLQCSKCNKKAMKDGKGLCWEEVWASWLHKVSQKEGDWWWTWHEGVRVSQDKMQISWMQQTTCERWCLHCTWCQAWLHDSEMLQRSVQGKEVSISLQPHKTKKLISRIKILLRYLYWISDGI